MINIAFIFRIKLYLSLDEKSYPIEIFSCTSHNSTYHSGLSKIYLFRVSIKLSKFWRPKTCSITKAYSCHNINSMKMTMSNQNFCYSCPCVPKKLFASFSSMMSSLKVGSNQLYAIDYSSTVNFDLPNFIRHLTELSTSIASNLFGPITSHWHLHRIERVHMI